MGPKINAVVTAILLLFPAWTGAQPIPPRLWVAPLSINTEASSAAMISTKLDEVLRQELKKPDMYTYVGRGNILLKVKAGSPDPRIEAAENMRTAGKGFFEAGQIDRAYAALLGALERYQIALPSLQRVESLHDTLIFLAAVDWTRGRKTAAQQWMLRAAAIWPEAEVDGLPPAVSKRLKRLQKRALRSRRGVLVVKTEPAGADVRVNGVDVGTSPVRVRHMANGRHYVQAKHPEFGMGGEVVRVRKNRGKATLKLRQNLGPPEAKKPSDTALKMFWSWTPRRMKRKAKRRFKQALSEASIMTQSQYALLPRLSDSADGKSQMLEMRLVHLKANKVIDFDPIPVTASISNIFVTAVAARKALESRLETIK